MAWLRPKTTCPQCKHKYQPVHASGSAIGSGCPICTKAEVEAKEIAHFAALDELTMEERIRKIEKWIYNYKPPRDPRTIKY